MKRIKSEINEKEDDWKYYKRTSMMWDVDWFKASMTTRGFVVSVFIRLNESITDNSIPGLLND